MPQFTSDNDGRIFDAAMAIVALWDFDEVTELDAKLDLLSDAIALVQEQLEKNRRYSVDHRTGRATR